MKIELNPDELRKGEKARRRTEMIGLGIYGLHKNRVFKSKKTYTRKSKHKNYS